MSDKDVLSAEPKENVDDILFEVLGDNGSYGDGFYDMFRRYSVPSPTEIKAPQADPAPAPAPQPAPVKEQPPVTPRNTAEAVKPADPTPEQIAEEYRFAAAKYEVNGYRISQPAPPVYPAPQPYMPYAQPMYPYAPYGQPYMPYGQPYPVYQAPFAPYGQQPYYDPNYAAPAMQEEAAQQPDPYAASAGERVVYDAEWENGARPAQVPAQNYSAYAQPAPAQPYGQPAPAQPYGQPAPAQYPPQNRPAAKPAAQVPKPVIPVPGAPGVGRKPIVNPAFIDPLSNDDEPAEEGDVSFSRRRPAGATDEEQNDFFQEGFSAAKINDSTAAGGKTETNAAAAADEDVFAAFSDAYESEQERKTRWMRTDEEVRAEKERRLAAAQERELRRQQYTPTVMPPPPEAKAEEPSLPAEADDDLAPLPADHPQASAPEELPAAVSEDDAFESLDEMPQIYDPEAFTDEEIDMNEGGTAMDYNSPSDIDEDTVSGRRRKKRGKFASFLYRNTPHRGQSKKDFISSLVMDVAFVVLLGGLVFCGIYFKNYSATKSSDSEIEGIYTETTAGNISLEEQWASLKAQYPDVSFPEGINIKLAKLYAINTDVVGWLTIENIGVSTVLLQSTDNAYYLYRDIYKEETKYGTPFVDAADDMQQTGLSRNTIVYGHNTHDGLKFHNLTKYLKLDGYKSAPVLTMETLFGGTTTWKVFAVCMADGDNETEFDFLYTDFNSESAFLSLVDTIRNRSIFNTNVDVIAGDKIMTLYTCYKNEISNGRLVVFAREVRNGESATVNVDTAAVNDDCIYPAAYYGDTAEAVNTTAAPVVQNTATTAAHATTEAAAVQSTGEAQEAAPAGAAATDSGEDNGEDSGEDSVG